MSKSALITGESHGIGFETAKKLLAEKNNYSCIVLTARESKDFEQAIDKLNRLNQYDKKIIHRYVDIGNHAQLKKSIQSIYKEIGNIHLLVNNAGYTNPVPLQLVKFDDFEKTMAVNLYAPFILVQDLLHLGNKRSEEHT